MGRVAEGADGVADGAGEEGGPGEDPDGGEQPEERDGDLAVVVGDAAGEEAGDVFVVEIEPGPAAVGGQAEAGGSAMGGLRSAARMCQGAAMARKTSVDGMRWNLSRRRSWRVIAR